MNGRFVWWLADVDSKIEASRYRGIDAGSEHARD